MSRQDSKPADTGLSPAGQQAVAETWARILTRKTGRLYRGVVLERPPAADKKAETDGT